VEKVRGKFDYLGKVADVGKGQKSWNRDSPNATDCGQNGGSEYPKTGLCIKSHLIAQPVATAGSASFANLWLDTNFYAKPRRQ
jgi:hypothetical protein